MAPQRVGWRRRRLPDKEQERRRLEDLPEKQLWAQKGRFPPRTRRNFRNISAGPCVLLLQKRLGIIFGSAFRNVGFPV